MLHILQTIPISLPEREIFIRLKYSIHKTKIDDVTRRKIGAVMQRGFALCKPQGSWLMRRITDKDAASVVFEGGFRLESASVAKLLIASEAAVFMGVTAGGAITDAAQDAVSRGDGSSAIILDAVGGATAEAAMEWLNRFIAGKVRPKGKMLTAMRFSAGYGDFSLAYQRSFFELLNLQRFGVRLTARCIFMPEKTVTAIAGVEPTGKRSHGQTKI